MKDIAIVLKTSAVAAPAGAVPILAGHGTDVAASAAVLAAALQSVSARANEKVGSCGSESASVARAG